MQSTNQTTKTHDSSASKKKVKESGALAGRVTCSNTLNKEYKKKIKLSCKFVGSVAFVGILLAVTLMLFFSPLVSGVLSFSLIIAGLESYRRYISNAKLGGRCRVVKFGVGLVVKGQGTDLSNFTKTPLNECTKRKTDLKTKQVIHL